ncbi:hypothetical protein, partial [Serratia marcescens]
TLARRAISTIVALGLAFDTVFPCVMPQQIPYCRERAGAVLGGSWCVWRGEEKINESEVNNFIYLLVAN